MQNVCANWYINTFFCKIVIMLFRISCPTSPNTLRPSLSRYYSQTNINSQVFVFIILSKKKYNQYCLKTIVVIILFIIN